MLNALLTHLESTGTGKEKLVALRSLADGDAPLSADLIAAAEKVVPEGTMLKIREYCAQHGPVEPEPKQEATDQPKQAEYQPKKHRK